jgi:ATP-dependent helicase/nuclease subunit A
MPINSFIWGKANSPIMETFQTKGALRLSASAGSGKTYSLTNLYLKKALPFPDSFRGIIAITFTNKAAAELKERIVQRLIQLTSKPIEDKDLTYFEFEKPELLQKRSTEVLNKILHDFDAFRVTTIDSFFQNLFSQLAFEANLPHGLRTELDIESVKKEVLEEGLKDIPENIKSILLENIIHILSEKGTGWRTSGYLENNLMSSLFAEPVVNFNYTAKTELMTDEKILSSKKILENYLKELLDHVKQSAKNVLQACEERGFSKRFMTEEDKTYTDELSKIEKIASGNLPPTAPIKAHLEGKWFRKPKSKLLSEADIDFFSPLILAYASSQNERQLANMALAEELLKHLAAIRLLVYFRQVLKNQNNRQNRFLLLETKHLLKSIIGDTDVPYIYERIGNQMHTLLIDEFQDTDAVQWAVINPLAKSILDNNGFFSVVGDVKQSIYGWRGADSTLFKKGLNESLLPHKVTEKNLAFNYRSEGNIVEFNNFIFYQISQMYGGELLKSEQVNGSKEWEETILLNYADVFQKLPDEKSKKNGFVDLRVRPRKKKGSGIEESEKNQEDSESDGENGYFNWIIDEIKVIQDAGIPSSEIAILVRGNSQLSEIVQIMDKERTKENQKYDFRYSASGSELNSEHLVFDFLATAISNRQLKDDFLFQNLVQNARHLGLDQKFWNSEAGQNPVWVQDWKKDELLTQNEEQNLKETLLFLVNYFELNLIESHHQAILQFQNYIFEFEQNQHFQYSEFLLWWKEKASQQKLNQLKVEEGIQIMTIHKSKGLDFGVVILALSSTLSGDSLNKFDFWPDSKQEPWDAYPLQKAKARKIFLDSDLGEQYQENIYKQALENLNLWYVACTRPRYGLVIDITLDNNLDLPKGKPTNFSRLAYQIPRFLKENADVLLEIFPDSKIESEENEDFIFKFQLGEQKFDRGKKDKNVVEILISPNFSKVKELKWLPKDQKEVAWFGTTFHKIIEKTKIYTNWGADFEKVTNKEVLNNTQIEELKAQVHRFFENENIKNWFSDKYESFPELEFVSKDGTILRADRVLKKEEGFVVLDFKTGEKSSIHFNQLKNYKNHLQNFSNQEVKAFVVYSGDQIEIEELTD